MDANSLKVLADALHEALPERDAEEVLRWARHPDAVRTLLEHQRELTGEGRCVTCAELSGRPHAAGCALMEAKRQLGLTWTSSMHELDLAHEAALGEARERSDERGAFAVHHDARQQHEQRGIEQPGVGPSP